MSRSIPARLVNECFREKKVFSVPSRVSKVVCVATNYSDDLNRRSTPLGARVGAASIFMKPASSVTSIDPTINLSGYQDVVCETEMALLVGKGISRSSRDLREEELMQCICGVGLAFDLTRKDLQNTLKSQGRPWELAKAFDNSCPVSDFRETSGSDWLDPLMDVKLVLNGELVLCEPIKHMILTVSELLATISQDVTLWPGDIVLTGTPIKPSSPPLIKPGDHLEASLGSLITVRSLVV
jgi:2-keto-4-pentenoate hydratase/2-oxohepta-3-ene-1,7-dioic acid hydratase in catechol pathway